MSRTIRIARFLSADSAERGRMFDDYIKMISFEGQRQIAPGYVERLRQKFETAPMSELIEGIEQDKKDIVYERQRWEIENKTKAREEERAQLNLRTGRDNYERTDDIFERAVCSDKNPQIDKKGMPAFDDEIGSYDKELKGYYGVHVGSGWLPVMKRDDYCSHKKAYIYAIDTSSMYNSKAPFYIMEDFHVMDKGSVPNSYILFSKSPVIPAKLITLEKIIPMSKVKTAPDPY